MKPEARAIALLVPLVLATLPPLAAGQDAAADDHADVFGIQITQDTEWADGTSYRDVNLTVMENATLTIRGATITLDNVTLRTRPNSTIRIESLPGKPAVLQGGAKGFDLRSGGETIIHGLPGDEVLFTGVRGQSGFSMGATALFLGGIALGQGTIDVEGLKVRNYTAGILLANQVTGRLNRLDVEGEGGIALAITESNVALGNSTFKGSGGTVFVSVPPGNIRIENLSFENVGTALTLRGAIVDLVGFRARNATTCLNALGYNHVIIRDFSCEEFGNAAILTSPTVSGRNNMARIDAERVTASTTKNVEAAIVATNSLGLRVRDSTLGPVNGPAILAKGIAPDLSGVTFHGVTDYNAVYLNPPENATFTVPGGGEPGAKGWLRVIRQSPFRLVDPSGAMVPGLRFDVTAEDTGVLAFSNKSLESGVVVPALETFTIDRRGQAREVTFRIDVGNQTAGARLDGYVPTNNETRVVVVQGQAPEFGGKKSPVPGAALAVAAVAAVALALRRRA